MTRRGALAGMLAGTGAARGQQLIGEPPGRIPPVEELVNLFEIEAVAQRKLDSALYALIAGGDRKAFDRMTFRPRMMVNTVELDLSIELFGQKYFAPVLAGPVSGLRRFHPEGEAAMTAGAGAAKTAVVLPAEAMQAASKAAAGWWCQVSPGDDAGKVQEAARGGCKAVCLTPGVAAGADWNTIDRLRKGLTVPFVLKGVMNAAEARAAADRGVQGIVVSSYRGPGDFGMASPMEALPAIVDAVAGKVPVLADGGFRRGTDILKALAMGARAVLIARPAVWGLSAYGARGVQHVFDLLHGELARNMVMLGAPNVGALQREMVRTHRW